MTKDNGYIGISTTIGAISGTVYGLRHPGEESLAKIQKLKPSTVDLMKEYRDSFDIMAAGQALKEGKITEDEYKKANDIRTAIHNTYEKEQQIIDIADTPLDERTKTFRQAVKEANATRPELWKSMFKLNGEFKQKLIDLKIFDNEKFTSAYNSAKKKTGTMYKELSKCAAKGLAIGAAAGIAIGVVLNKIANKG